MKYIHKSCIHLFAALLLICSVQANDFDVVINEINYYPVSAGKLTSGDLEWIELYNRGAKVVDLSGWSFTEGISFTFPEKTLLPGQGFLVICKNLEAFQTLWGERNAVGNYALRLSNCRERVTLSNSGYLIVDTIVYDDGFPWPQEPNGYGSTLELTNPYSENDDPALWTASCIAGGTPALPNSCLISHTEIIPHHSPWNFWRGTEEPPGETAAWVALEYDDSMWELAEAPFGYGSEEYYFTNLDDMYNKYSTLFLRYSFEIIAPADFENIRLSADFDDGFTAYLNGEEIARMNMNSTGIPGHSEEAVKTHESGISSVWNISPSFLREGQNILSIVAANRTKNGSDFLIDASLTGVKFPKYSMPPRIIVNEIGSQDEGIWVELLNLSSEDVDLSDYYLSFESLSFTEHQLSGVVKSNEFAVFSIDPVPSFSGVVILTRGLESQLVSGLKYSLSSGGSYGLWPNDIQQRSDLAAPTPGEKNQPPQLPSIHITEINYHPSSENNRDEFIELYNSGDSIIDLSKWRFTRGIEYSFPQGVFIFPQKYLLIVPDSDYAAEKYPGTAFIGNFSGGFDNSGERICLEDSNGTHVVDFYYADDGSWPRGADGPVEPNDEDDPFDPGGQGMTLELRHIAFDPSAGSAWIAETENGTPGAPRRNPEENPPPIVYDYSIDPQLPEPETAVLINAKVFCPSAIQTVECMWRYEGDEEWNSLPLLDDGLNIDGEAGDNLWGGFLVSLNRTGTVFFHFKCENTDGVQSTLPHNIDQMPYLLRVEEKLFPTSDDGDFIRLIMTNNDLERLRNRNTRSNLLLPCSIVRNGKIYQYGKVRYRGSSARSHTPKSYRIELTHDESLPEAKFLYLNACYPINQFMGMNTFRRAGIPTPRAKLVSLGMGDGFWSDYIQMERIDEFFSDFHLPGDDGNLYRGERCNDFGGDLSYFGDNEDDYKCGYSKQTNSSKQDWSDIVQLCRALNSPPADYMGEIEKILDIDQWCRYFAVHTILSNQETSIYRNHGDDYFLYRRESDGRFILLPWDMDTVFEEPEERLFLQTLDAVKRFLTHSDIAPRYWHHLDKLIDRTFTAEAVNNSFLEAGGLMSGTYVNNYLAFRKTRTEFIRKQLYKTITACSTIIENVPPIETLIPRNSEWMFFRGKANPSEGILWTEMDFDELNWETGPAGFGYGDEDDNTELTDMPNEYTTVYLRKTLTLDSAADLALYQLEIDFDDGFVCYLNGHEILRSYVDSDITIVQYDDTADSSHEEEEWEVYDLGPFAGFALDGNNILALVGLNRSNTSSDFSLHPSIIPKSIHTKEWQGGCGSTICVQEGTQIYLTGKAPVTQTSFVDVNGHSAPYDVLSGDWSITLNEVPETITVTARDYANQAVSAKQINVVKTLPANVPASINEDLTLTMAQSPYLLSGVTIESDAVLTVEAGCKFITTSNQALRVQGELNILGTEENPVIFNKGDDSTKPQIIVDGGKASLQSVDFSSSSSTGLPGTNDRISSCGLESGELILKSCTFTEVPFYCVVAQNGTLTVEDCIFSNSGGGLLLQQNVTTTISGSGFHELGPKDAVHHRSSGELTINGCRFSSLKRGGINTTGPAAVSECVILDVCGAGIVFIEAASRSVESSLIARCGTAVLLTAGADSFFNHLTIAENDLAFNILSMGSGETAAEIKNSIIWNNYKTAELRGKTAIHFSYSILQDDSAALTNNNLFEDPDFTSPIDGQWTLKEDSPAIGQADDGSNLGAFPKTATVEPVLGDLNGDQILSIADVIKLLAYLYQDGEEPWCLPMANTNGDSIIGISDAVYLLAYLFADGEPPFAPQDPCPDSE